MLQIIDYVFACPYLQSASVVAVHVANNRLCICLFLFTKLFSMLLCMLQIIDYVFDCPYLQSGSVVAVHVANNRLCIWLSLFTKWFSMLQYMLQIIDYVFACPYLQSGSVVAVHVANNRLCIWLSLFTKWFSVLLYMLQQRINVKLGFDLLRERDNWDHFWIIGTNSHSNEPRNQKARATLAEYDRVLFAKRFMKLFCWLWIIHPLKHGKNVFSSYELLKNENKGFL